MISLVLENFGIIGTREFTFGTGLNAMLGPNGSGKSTVVNAIYFALTGASLDRVDSVSDLITWGSSRGSVCLADGTIELSRSISSTGTISHRLTTADGSVKLVRKNEVNEYVLKYYNIESLDALDYIYFSQQLAADQFIMATTAARLDIMMKIFGLSKVDKARDILLSAIQSIKVETSSDDLHKQLISAEQEAAGSLAQSELDLKQKQEAYAEAGTNTEELRIVAEEAPLVDDVLTLDLDIRVLSDKIETHGNEFKSIVVPAEPDRSAASKFDTYKKVCDQLEALSTELSNLSIMSQAELQELTELVDVINSLRHERTAEIAKLSKDIESFSSGFCPTCHTSTESLGIDIEALRKQRDEASLELAQITADLQTTQKQLQDETNKIAHRNQRLAVHKSLQDQEASLSAYKNFNADSYKTALNEYTAAVDARNQLTTAIRMLNDQKNEMTRKRQQMTAKHEPVTKDQKLEAQEKISYGNLLKKSMEEAENRKNSAIVAHDSAVSALRLYEEMLERNKNKAAFIDTLKAVRDMIHRDNIPRILLEETNFEINEGLERLLKGVDFKYPVYVTPSGDIQYDTDLVEGRDARRLSGGQRYVLANILRIVFADVTDSHLPLMILDEPTTCLDAPARGTLAEMLEKLGCLLEDRGSILIVPTHDEMVIAGANHLVKI